MAGNGIKPSALANPSADPGEFDIQEALQFKPNAAQVQMQSQVMGAEQSPPSEATVEPQKVPAAEDPLASLYQETHGAAQEQDSDPLASLFAETHSKEAAPKAEEEEGFNWQGVGNFLANPVVGTVQNLMKETKHEKLVREENQKDAEAVPASVMLGYGLATNEWEKNKLLQDAYPGAKISKYNDEHKVELPDGTKLVTSAKGNISNLAKYAGDVAGMASNIATDIAAGLGAVAGTGPGALAMVGGISALGATADKMTREYLARVYGVEQDPSRNKTVEYATNAVLGSIFSIGGKVLMKAIGGKVATNEVTSTLAKTAGDVDTKAINKSLDLVDEVMKANPEVKVDPAMPNVLTGSQLDPLNKTLEATEQSMQGNEVFNNALTSQRKVVQELWDNVTGKISSAKEGAQSAYSKIAAKVKNSLSLDGQDIGEYTSKVVNQHPNEVVSLDATKNLLTPQSKWTDADGTKSIMENLGLHIKPAEAVQRDVGTGIARTVKTGDLAMMDVDGKPVAATAENIKNKLISFGAKEENAGEVAKLILSLQQNIHGEEAGKMTLAKADLFRKRIEALAGANKADGATYPILKQLKNAFSGDFIVGAEKFVASDVAQSYAQAKAGYYTGKRVEETLGKLVGNNSDLFDAAFYDKIFKSKDPQTIMHVKEALGNDPEAFKELVGGYIDNIFKSSKNDITKASEKLMNLDPHILNEMSNGKGKELKNAFDLMSRAKDKMSMANVSEGATDLAVQGMLMKFKGAGFSATKRFIYSMTDALTGDARVVKYLAKKAPEDFVPKAIQGPEREAMLKTARIMIDSASAKQAGLPAQIAREAIVRKTQQEIRKGTSN